MSNTRIRTAGSSGIAAAAVPGGDQVMNLEDVAQYLRCSTEEAQAFLETNQLVGVELPSGPRYLQSDVFAAFLQVLTETRQLKSEAARSDEMQSLWVTWLNRVQALLTPAEQEVWVKLARNLMSRKLPPAEFFRRGVDERQNLVKAAGIDFKLREDYGNFHLGLEPSKASGVKPALTATRVGVPTTRPGSKPFGS